MDAATVTIIGAGQAGLAMSRCLTGLSVDHILLERAKVANSWKSERWDSLRTLTPNWMSRLPQFQYNGGDPDGFMTAGEIFDYLESYRRSFGAPVVEGTCVLAVARTRKGFDVATTNGPVAARAIVVATGGASDPHLPSIGAAIPSDLTQMSPIQYRNPGQVEPGGILVVGASASGIQIAEELAMAGRHVVLAVGGHVRVPRTYRGMDIHWWMSSLGILDERYDQIDDLSRVRSVPSLQLIGSYDRRDLNLNTVRKSDVEVVGRLVGITGSYLQFSGSLANEIASADLKQNRLLSSIDDYATANGLDAELTEPYRPESTRIPNARTSIGLNEFATVIWATGYRPRYPWLDGTLLNSKGVVRHDGGVMAQPGMYAMGLQFMRRRKSNFIDGVGDDARELSAHLMNYLDRVAARS